MQQTKPRILVKVEGGLGDQVSAEASLRYLREKIYPTADIQIECRTPRVFDHLGLPTHLISRLSDTLPNSDDYTLLETFSNKGPIAQALCFLVSHISNYHAASLLSRELPLLNKTVRLMVYEEDRRALSQLLSGIDPRSLILVHAGKSWGSKTFPREWWQATIDLLAAAGLTVCLIGQKAGGGSDDLTSFVEVSAPRGAVDLRNKLSLGVLFALMEAAPVLLSNDSSPIQIAGAFDNWIVMIPSCKHPDFVFPYRHGTPYYKTRAVCKRLLVDDRLFEPITGVPLVPNYEVPDWTPYLPEPKNILETIRALPI